MRTLFLTLITCLFVLPAQAKYSGGTGEPNDPYQIATAADLIALGETPDDYGKHFILTADIDLDPNLPGRKVFDKALISPDTNPVKYYYNGTPFIGVFDGNGHTISRMSITGTGGGYLGLFGVLDSKAEVEDLRLVDVNVTDSSGYVGGLVGFNGGSVIHCYIAGVVAGSQQRTGGLVGYNGGRVIHCYNIGVVSGNSEVGGLVGNNGGIVTRCYSTGAVGGRWEVGGLVGENCASVTQCYSTGTVSGGSSVGGLVGSGGGDMAQCYSTGTVSGDSSVGGLVGSNVGNISKCYSTGATIGNEGVGGLVGSGYPSVLHSIWDMQTSGLSESVGGVGLTTAEMMDPDILGLNGFASDPNWVLDVGRDYPRLAWEGTTGQIIPEPDIDWLKGCGTVEDPYQIETAEQLIFLSRASVLWDRNFILVCDIDLDPNLEGRQFFQQAPIQTFSGIFDGNDHTISQLTITGGGYLGLFGKLAGEVKDLGVLHVDITGSGSLIGGLAGENSGTVTHCYSSGAIRAMDFSWYIGGLIGRNNGNMTRCYSTGAVTGGWHVGGLVGYNYYDSTMIQCYSTGAVSGGPYIGGIVGDNRGGVTRCYSSGAVGGSWHVGGLVGRNNGNVTQCYCMGAVWASGVSRFTGIFALVGGLVGYNHSGGTVIQCYSTGTVLGTGECIGGLVGDNGDDSAIIQSFWDVQTSGEAVSDGGTGKTTAEMQMTGTFLEAGWDFVGEDANSTEDIWWILEGQDYPRLWWEAH